jgi:hypothetical protein
MRLIPAYFERIALWNSPATPLSSDRIFEPREITPLTLDSLIGGPGRARGEQNRDQ